MLRSATHALIPFTLGIFVGASGLAVAAHALTPSQELVSVARDQTTRIEQTLGEVRSDDTRQRLAHQVARLQETLGHLQSVVDHEAQDGPGRVVVVAPPPPPAPHAISGGELQSILGAIDANAFSDDKIAVLRSASAGRWFTVDQVHAIMDHFAFGDDKVDAGAMLYPQVVDPQDWYRIYAALPFSSDRDALRSRTEG